MRLVKWLLAFLVITAVLVIGAFFLFPPRLSYKTLGGSTRIVVVQRNAPTHGFLGVEFRPRDEGRGLLLTSVLPESGAAEAEVHLGDILLAVDKTSVSNSDAIQSVLAAKDPGDTVTLEIKRDGQQISIRVALMSFEELVILRGQVSNAP
jgi:S1-C subfamily serine protease